MFTGRWYGNLRVSLSNFSCKAMTHSWTSVRPFPLLPRDRRDLEATGNSQRAGPAETEVWTSTLQPGYRMKALRQPGSSLEHDIQPFPAAGLGPSCVVLFLGHLARAPWWAWPPTALGAQPPAQKPPLCSCCRVAWLNDTHLPTRVEPRELCIWPLLANRVPKMRVLNTKTTCCQILAGVLRKGYPTRIRGVLVFRKRQHPMCLALSYGV